MIVSDLQTPPALGDLETRAVQPSFNFDSALAGNGFAWFVAKGRTDSSGDARTICYRRTQWNGSVNGWVDSDWQTIAGGYVDYYDIPPGGTVRAPQSGPSIDVARQGSKLISMAVIRKIGIDNFLWTCHHVGLDGPDSSYNGGAVDRIAVQWLKFQVDASTLTYNTHGRIFDSAMYSGLNTPYSYYMPSLNVNSLGDMVVGCSGSRAAEHVSAFFFGRKARSCL